MAVFDGSDNLIMRFEYADARMPVSMTKNGNTYYLSYDQVGSLRLISDPSGNVVKQISYDSFGNIIADSNPGFAVPFGFAGGLHERDTGLVRFGARDYDPTIGKWTAKDPIDFAGGDTNLYGYVGNNPVNWVDPFGLRMVCECQGRLGSSECRRTLRCWWKDDPPPPEWLDEVLCFIFQYVVCPVIAVPEPPAGAACGYIATLSCPSEPAPDPEPTYPIYDDGMCMKQ